MAFQPHHNRSVTTSVGVADVQAGPFGMGVVQIDNRGQTPVLLGLGGSPDEASGINIRADCVVEVFVQNLKIYLRRPAGAASDIVSITPGAVV